MPPHKFSLSLMISAFAIPLAGCSLALGIAGAINDATKEPRYSY